VRKVYSRIEAIAGNVITVTARGARYDELALVNSAHGQSLAQVIRLDQDKVSLQVFSGARGISTGDEVRFLGHSMQVSFSENLLGVDCDNKQFEVRIAPVSKACKCRQVAPALQPEAKIA
jgi:V/A-type H+-transporting ATPase subunit B